MCEVDVDPDGIEFKEDAEHEGVRVQFNATLARARVPKQLDAIGARRNDVDFIRRISATQPIRVAEHLCRTEHSKGPHWRNGFDQDTRSVLGLTEASVA